MAKTKNPCVGAMAVIQSVAGEKEHYDPEILCSQFEISLVTDKELRKDGYFVCGNGSKLIFANSNITNRHRKEFVIAHEVGHFLMHQDQLFCCSNVSAVPSARVNTSRQEKEANAFASELLAPINAVISLIPNKPLQFLDISLVASRFDISMSHAAIKCVENSKTENDILLCYDRGNLKWVTTKKESTLKHKLPLRCPMDFESVTKPMYVKGIWDDVFTGRVYQEIFSPYKDQYLVLLSGDMIEDEEGECYE